MSRIDSLQARRHRALLQSPPEAGSCMSEGFWIVIAIIVAVTIYVLAKVVFYARRSEQQWSEVDKTKLKDWDDEEEW